MFGKSFTSITTERLVLRRLQEKDFPEIYAYRNDKIVAEYQSWTDKTEEQIQNLIKEQATTQPHQPDDWFMFGIVDKATEKLIGDCAFNVNKEDSSQAELGITLSSAAQGKHFAKEAITAVLNYVLDASSSLERVNLITYKENTACIYLINKLGISQVTDTNIAFSKNGKTDQELYDIKENEIMFAVTKQEWLKKKSQNQSQAALIVSQRDKCKITQSPMLDTEETDATTAIKPGSLF